MLSKISRDVSLSHEGWTIISWYPAGFPSSLYVDENHPLGGVYAELTPKKRDIGGITTVIHPIFGWITVVIYPNSSAISGLSTPISVHAAYAKKGFWFHVNNES